MIQLGVSSPMIMNIHSYRFFSAAAIAGGILVALVTGCSKQERADAGAKAKEMYTDAGAKAKEVYADTKAAISRGWDKFKSATFDKRGDVEAQGKALAAEMEAQASKLRANYSDAKASASRKAAMEEFKKAEADYKQKLSALGSASADTWESAKNNTIAAWDRLEAAYRKALVE
jgi:hypothetical protein